VGVPRLNKGPDFPTPNPVAIIGQSGGLSSMAAPEGEGRDSLMPHGAMALPKPRCRQQRCRTKARARVMASMSGNPWPSPVAIALASVQPVPWVLVVWMRVSSQRITSPE